MPIGSGLTAPARKCSRRLLSGNRPKAQTIKTSVSLFQQRHMEMLQAICAQLADVTRTWLLNFVH